MRKYYACLIITFLFLSTVHGQKFPLNFPTSLDAFTTFNGASFSIVGDPLDNTNPVAQFVNSGSMWEGGFLDITTAIDLASAKIITLKFYSSDANLHTVLIKLENGTDSDVEVSQSATGIGWHSLNFDFSAANLSPPNSGTINASGAYNRIVVFIDGGQFIPGNYLIDDIDGGMPGTATNEVDVVYDELVWGDEFDGSGAVSAVNWFAEIEPPNNGSWFNGEVQHYTNRIDNAELSDGTLKIIAKKEMYTAFGSTKEYTSARLNSLFSFTYGRVDVRAKMPVGDGTWPAIWMLGTSIGNSYTPPTIPWPLCGEIDIMEHWGNNPNSVHGSIHNGASSGATVNTNSIWAYDVSNTFHVYSVNWSPDQISFLVDDEIHYTYDPAVHDANTWPFDDPQFILLNIAMGGVGGPIDPAFVESTMEIDYVRVYQETTLGNSDEAFNKIRLYPNPTFDNVEMEVPAHFIGGQAVIYSLIGQPIHSFSVNHVRSTIDMSGLVSGVYILRIKKEDAIGSFKFIRE